MNNTLYFNVEYTTGGGTVHSEGIWSLKKTLKTITVSKLFLGGVFDMYKVGIRLRIGKGTGNPMNDHEDGTFTVYFSQAGTPYYFNSVVNSYPHPTDCK